MAKLVAEEESFDSYDSDLDLTILWVGTLYWSTTGLWFDAVLASSCCRR